MVSGVSMRLFEIDATEAQQALDMLPTIERECSEFIEVCQAEKRYLWRASRRHGGPYYAGMSRQGDRRPSDLGAKLQVRIDRFLIAKGFKALRNNSTFAWTGSTQYPPHQYSGGAYYMLFPVNGFHYTWSTKFGDLYEYVSDLLSEAENVVADSVYYSQPHKERSEIILQVLTGDDPVKYWLDAFDGLFSYHNTGFGDALNSASEIMINGKYHAIHSSLLKQVTSYFFKDNN